MTRQTSLVRIRSPRRKYLAAALRVALAVPLLAAPLIGLAQVAQVESGIEVLSSLGGGESRATGVSAGGSVVVGTVSMVVGTVNDGEAIGDQAFRWTPTGGVVYLGTLGGTSSRAYAVSADGKVVVGQADNGEMTRAFRWTESGGMEDIGSLGGLGSGARATSADGQVIVGWSRPAGWHAPHAFRWVNGTMTDLGTLGGSMSHADGVSADGLVVVGDSQINGDVAFHAFRWTSNGMVGLGTLGGTNSFANGVSADGSVIVGEADIDADETYRAFRWTSASGMVDLGTLGGPVSRAQGVSADGSVVVGGAAEDLAWRAFRWTEASGMQSVEDWLRDHGVTVTSDTTHEAWATSSDGNVIVGELFDGDSYVPFIARVSPVGSGLVTLADVQQSLDNAADAGGMALRSSATAVNGAHSRPLMRRVAPGQNTFWLAGDWGRDDHGQRRGSIGLAEFGLGRNFGPAQLNVSLGQTWAQQDQALDSRAKVDGTYLLAEALFPITDSVWATLGGYRHWGKADLRRGYFNAGARDHSTGKPDVDTWSLRIRLDWENAWQAAGTSFTPYADLSYGKARLAAYTETGGGFPARFDARTDKATELRIGVNASKPLDNGWRVLGTLEATHRSERDGPRTSGEVIGLFSFDLDGRESRRDWLRAGVGVEGAMAGGTASIALNASSRGEAATAWLALGWQKAF